MRLDQLLLQKNIVRSRTQAQKMITAGQVMIGVAGQWEVATKPSLQCEEHLQVKITVGEEQRFVSRAGLKLDGALATFNVDPSGLVCLDVGQSTGGFTDCLLQKGAAKVVGLDVGHTQLAASLRGDPRVVCIEGINARELPMPELFEYNNDNPFALAVMDVSFISQTLILPGLVQCLAKGGLLVSLVKPQFEVGPGGLAKGGIVKNDALFAEVEAKLRQAATTAGLEVLAYTESVIEGTDGNREFFLLARKH